MVLQFAIGQCLQFVERDSSNTGPSVVVTLFHTPWVVFPCCEGRGNTLSLNAVHGAQESLKNLEVEIYNYRIEILPALGQKD